MDVYYIGSSPGSGKNSIAKKLSNEYGIAYYKLDDFLFRSARDGYVFWLSENSIWFCDAVPPQYLAVTED